jgi:hypothetical protein
MEVNFYCENLAEVKEQFENILEEKMIGLKVMYFVLTLHFSILEETNYYKHVTQFCYPART